MARASKRWGRPPLRLGIWLLTCLGTLIVVLPGSGLQFAVVGFLPQRTQSIVMASPG